MTNFLVLGKLGAKNEEFFKSKFFSAKIQKLPGEKKTHQKSELFPTSKTQKKCGCVPPLRIGACTLPRWGGRDKCLHICKLSHRDHPVGHIFFPDNYLMVGNSTQENEKGPIYCAALWHLLGSKTPQQRLCFIPAPQDRDAHCSHVALCNSVPPVVSVALFSSRPFFWTRCRQMGLLMTTLRTQPLERNEQRKPSATFFRNSGALQNSIAGAC